MPGNKDDDVPQAYPYLWAASSKLTLPEFLAKYKPSMVQDDGTKPWIWVAGAARSKTQKDHSSAVEEASAALKEITDKVESIKNDASIPTRSNKKTGAKSKKEIREQVQAEATEKLKEISIRHGYVQGKWLIFAPSDKVDLVWSSLAQSLVDGPLATTAAYLTKVATCPRNETPNYQHVLCLYMPDVYDREAVTAVMKILLRDHGLNLSGVKSDLYTTIGVDSKHPSGIQSTVWKNTALLKEAEIKELKDAYFEELKNRPAAAATTDADTPAPAKTGAPSKQKPKPKPKKKATEDDPFASDDDDDDAAERTDPVQGKVKPDGKKGAGAGAGRKRPKSADEDGEEEEDERVTAKRKKVVKT